MGDFTYILQKISARQDLLQEEAVFALQEVINGRVNSSRMAAFLFGMSCKGETVTELTAFVNVMRDAAVAVTVDTESAIDLCGTGGDHSGTFNISTAAMFVAAGADVPVLKHGNAGVSSRSGSFDVLRCLGVRPDLEKDQVETCFRQTGMAFMFAPLYHPAMARVMPVRKELGMRTFFNIMGPMLNPARVRRQMVGAFSRDTAQNIIRILGNLDTEFAYSVHAEDGLDEFSTSAPSHVFQLKDGQVSNGRVFDAGVFGLSVSTSSDLMGGSPEENAAIIRAVLDDNATRAQREIVLLNAAFAIHASGLQDDIHEAFYAAEESLESGSARNALENFATCTSDLHTGS
jgi:anthranilate phosphoribosyltransferase